MSTPLRVLILEDRPEDAELMLHELRRAGFEPAWQRVETELDYLAQLHEGLDAILADYTLPQFDALRALQLLQEHGLDIPLIIVSGLISEEAAIECLKQGAADYLLKDRLARLGPALTHALQEKKLRDEKRQAETALWVTPHPQATAQCAAFLRDQLSFTRRRKAAAHAWRRCALSWRRRVDQNTEPAQAQRVGGTP